MKFDFGESPLQFLFFKQVSRLTMRCSLKLETKFNTLKNKKFNSHMKAFFRFIVILQIHVEFGLKQVEHISQWKLQATHILIKKEVQKIGKILFQGTSPRPWVN
jgi:hypothetical protein